VLDLRGISSFTDFFVICSGTSEPQLKAIANEIETHLREHYSLRPVAVDGFPASQWMVLDYLQVVVTFFIATNAPSTAWKACGAMPQCCSGNQSQGVTAFPPSPLKTDGCPSRRSLSVASALLLGWRRLRRRRNLRRTLRSTLWRRCWRRFHILQFDVKNQGRVRTDVRTHCTLAIREGRGNEQLILCSLLHQLKRFVQPLITPLTGKVAGWPRLYELSNSVPSIRVPR
jgi:iojap-like ribosome-associated protein